MKSVVKRVEQFLLQRFLWVMGTIACAGLLLTVGLTSPVLAQQAPSTESVATAAIDYAQLASWSSSSPVPLRLPQQIVYSDTLESRGKFWGIGGLTTDAAGQVWDGYDVSIIDSAYCYGGLSCALGYATAELITAETKPVDQVYDNSAELAQPDIRSAGHVPGWVQLTEQQQVFLAPWTLNPFGGAGFEMAVWDEGGYRYVVALKLGDPDWLLQMVRSIWSGS